MVEIVFAVILWLAPATSDDEARVFAQHIVEQGEHWSIDPLLIAAEIHLETRDWNPRAVGPTNDYCLMQLHVCKNSNSDFVGREKELFDPAVCIARGVKQLNWWRWFHKRKCDDPQEHPWWSHYKWGRVVRDKEYGQKVGRIYRRIKRWVGAKAKGR